jgi:hypothetical protein
MLRLANGSPFGTHSDEFQKAAEECYKLVEETEQEAEKNEGKITSDQLSTLQEKFKQLKTLHPQLDSYFGKLLVKTLDSLFKVQEGQADVMFSSLGVYDCELWSEANW